MFYIIADGLLVASSTTINEDKYAIDSTTNITLETENKAGSFSFNMYSTHYLYNVLKKFKTIVKVYLDNDCIFIGRIMNFTTTSETKGVYCEGCLGFFNDTIQEKFDKKSITPADRLKEIIENHNKQVETDKRFSIGIITIDNHDVPADYESTNFTDSFSALSSDIIDRFGGYFRIREERGEIKLDWLKNYNHICTQPVWFGENLVEYSENDTEDDIWSIIYPNSSELRSDDEGGDIEYTIASVNNGSPLYEVPDRIDIYGRIVKNVSFENITSDQELLDKAKEWVEKHNVFPDPTVTITAVDLGVIFPEIDRFALGDSITFKLGNDTFPRTLRCTKIEYNLFKPGETELTLGTPLQSLTEVYLNDKAETANRIDSVNSKADSNTKTNSSNTKRLELAEANIELNAQNITMNANNITMNAQNIALNADNITANAKQIDIQGENIKLHSEEIKKQGDRITEAEASIEVHAGQIALKASQTDLDYVDLKYQDEVKRIDGEVEGNKQETSRLASRVTAAEIDINGKEGTIGLKAQYAQLYGDMRNVEKNYETLSGYVDEVGERASQALIDIDAANARIDLKANQTAMEEIGKRVSNAEIAIDANTASINLKADQTVTAALGERITSAEIDIDGAKAAINLKADAKDVTDIGERLNSAEIAIDGANAKIDLKADSSVVTGLSERVNSAEIAVDGANAKIELKADSTVVNELGERVSSAEITIDGLNSEIDLKADKITLDGYVTASKLETELAKIKITDSSYVTTAGLNTQSLGANYVETNSLSVSGVVVKWASTEVVTGASLNLNVSKGSCYAYSTTSATVRTKIDYVAGVSGSVSTDTVTLQYLGR